MSLAVPGRFTGLWQGHTDAAGTWSLTKPSWEPRPSWRSGCSFVHDAVVTSSGLSVSEQVTSPQCFVVTCVHFRPLLKSNRYPVVSRCVTDWHGTPNPSHLVCQMGKWRNTWREGREAGLQVGVPLDTVSLCGNGHRHWSPSTRFFGFQCLREGTSPLVPWRADGSQSSYMQGTVPGVRELVPLKSH